MKTPKDHKTGRWYKGWGNIITILSFFTFIWPISILIMWTISEWSRKTKSIITFVMLLFLGGTYLSIFAGRILFSDTALENRVKIMESINGFAFITIFISLIIAIIATVVRHKIGKRLGEIWIPTSIVVGVSFLLIIFNLLSWTSWIYSATQ